MRRNVLVPLVVGWLLGLLTAFVWPDLTAEHRTLVVSTLTDRASLRDLTETGWRVVRTDTAGSTPIVQVERPRYLAARDQLQSWWENLMVRIGAASPPTPTPVSKPT